jgi:hypothetical protein
MGVGFLFVSDSLLCCLHGGAPFACLLNFNLTSRRACQSLPVDFVLHFPAINRHVSRRLNRQLHFAALYPAYTHPNFAAYDDFLAQHSLQYQPASI